MRDPTLPMTSTPVGRAHLKRYTLERNFFLKTRETTKFRFQMKTNIKCRALVQDYALLSMRTQKHFRCCFTPRCCNKFVFGPDKDSSLFILLCAYSFHRVLR